MKSYLERDEDRFLSIAFRVAAHELRHGHGKSARGSRDRRCGKHALHMVTAWGSRDRLVLGQEATAEKSNAIGADAKRFARAVRGHWGVENSLHWRIDVVLNEDVSRIRKGNVPAIMTSIRQLCMNLFEQEPFALRLSQKRRKAAWNDDYRAKVLFGRRFIRARPDAYWRL
ncbi:MAG: hypothetical protein WBG92_08935 [Thiohalocapsa sp.]